jgi:nucleolar GTP-binding protein
VRLLFRHHQQASLLRSIRPLFANKPRVLAINKTDLVQLFDLTGEDKDTMAAVQADFKTERISMSTIEESGVSKVMGSCCDKLKEQRVDAKISAARRWRTCSAGSLSRSPK